MLRIRGIICFLLLLFSFSKIQFIFAQESQTQIFNIRVLYVIINPVEGNRNLYETYLQNALGGKTADQFTDYWANQYINSFKRLSGNTINYKIALKLQVTNFPKHTQGIEYTLETYYQDCILRGGANSDCEKHCDEIDYQAFINDNRICEIAGRNNIDEIWVMEPYALQNGEDFVIGPTYGPPTNGYTKIVNTCSKFYNVTVANAQVPYNFLESYAHRVETQMRYLIGNWSQNLQDKYWYNFWLKETTAGSFCGNAHSPPNFTHDYDFANQTFAISTCSDWKNFPYLKGETEEINCQAWNCDNASWQEYWLGSLPRSDGEALIEDREGKNLLFRNNWWYYLLDPNEIAKFVRNFPRPASTINRTLTRTPTLVLIPTLTSAFTPLPVASSFRNDESNKKIDWGNWQYLLPLPFFLVILTVIKIRRRRLEPTRQPPLQLTIRRSCNFLSPYARIPSCSTQNFLVKLQKIAPLMPNL